MKKLGVVIALLLALVGCDADTPSNPSEARGKPYAAGGTYDAEDYNGPVQEVTGTDIEPAVMGTRPKYKSERYCSSKKPNGTCKTWGTRRVPDGTETYVQDDTDWIIILADGSRIDVDEATFNRYQGKTGLTYP
jgi:hypothetical protein